MTKKEKSSVIDRYRNKVKDENRRYIKRNLDISNQISDILERKDLSQKDLAKLLGKHESEVSKLLSGLHNLTLKSISKMEAVLGEDIILTPIEACKKYSKTEYVILKVAANKNKAGKIHNQLVASGYQNKVKQDKAA